MREWSVIEKFNHASVIAPDMPLSAVKSEGIPAFPDGVAYPGLDSNLFYNFFQQTNQLAWIVDEEGTLLCASKAFFRYFDIDEKQCINRNVIETIPIAVTHSLYELHRRVSSTGHPAETTQRIRLANGNSLICHLNLFSLGTFNGKKLVGGQAIRLPDTSDLEKKFHQAQERLLTLNRATSDAIWEWDMQSGQMVHNDTLPELFGYKPNTVRGLSWWLRQIHPEDRNRIADKVRDAIAKHEQSWTDEYRFKCADNHYKHIQHKGFVVYENGLPVKMIGSLNDVSNLKALEDKLAAEKIKRQKEISEIMVKAQETERTRIGHELHDNVNQLLSATKLFVDYLTPVGKEQRLVKQKSIDYIQLTIDEIRKLSKELVAPSLKEKGLVQSIRGLVEDIEMVDAMKIRFEHDEENDQLSNGKKVAIFRIAQEQLKNILKHSHAKNTMISLFASDKQVKMVIADDGEGFNPQQTYQGIGLGNIRERVNFYNGTVDIQSARGHGCKLTVIIPCMEE
jgi:PAS domain S-box-containing protein